MAMATFQIGGNTISETNPLPIVAGTAGQPDVIAVTPTITAGAYSAGDVLGGRLTIPNAVAAEGGKAVLYSLVVMDRDNEKAEFSVLFYRSQPAQNSLDNAAFAWGTGDGDKYLGRIDVIASDYKTFASRAVAKPTFQPFVVESDTTSLYAYVVLDGGPTYTATTDVTLTFGFLR
jgi:hypothetical protein